MTLEKQFRRDDALLWEASGADQHGEATVLPVTPIKVRWTQVNRAGVDAKGNPVTISVEVVADRLIPVDSVMWLGKLSDTPGTSETPVGDFMKVVSSGSVKDVKSRHAFYTASLARHGDRLPSFKE